MVNPCVEPFKEHDFTETSDGGKICKRCGYKIKSTSVRKKAERKTVAGRPNKIEQTISRTDAKDGISMILLAAQTVIVTARPEFKEDALTARERDLLADALTDEAMGSVTIKKWLTRVGQQQKHTKLIMVLIAIAMPRLARRGIIPQDQEMTDEFVAQAGKTTEFSGVIPAGSEIDFESIPVESGGSPFTNRRNGIGEDDLSGVVAETAPIRNSVENENGRREISHASGSEISPIHDESEIEPDRTTSRSHSRRSKAS